MNDLGEFGFWLAGGAVVIAMIWSGARKERDKERQKQETFRMLAQLEADGKLTPETLKYMRERDAVEHHIVREMSGATISPGAIAGLVVGVLSVVGGLISWGATYKQGQPWQVQVGVMFGVWAGGLLLAFALHFLFRNRKKDTPPGA